MIKLKTLPCFNLEVTLCALVLCKCKCGAVSHSIAVVKGCTPSVQLLCLHGACRCLVELVWLWGTISLCEHLTELDRKWAGNGDVCVLGVEAARGVTHSSLAS